MRTEVKRSHHDLKPNGILFDFDATRWRVKILRVSPPTDDGDVADEGAVCVAEALVVA